jgi:hypothetical protein
MPFDPGGDELLLLAFRYMRQLERVSVEREFHRTATPTSDPSVQRLDDACDHGRALGESDDETPKRERVDCSGPWRRRTRRDTFDSLDVQVQEATTQSASFVVEVLSVSLALDAKLQFELADLFWHWPLVTAPWAAEMVSLTRGED